VVRVVEEPEQEQHRRRDDRDRSHHRRLNRRALCAVGEEEHVGEEHRGADEEDDPQRDRNHAFGPVRAVLARVLAVGALVEPLRVRRLLRRGARLDRLHGPEHRNSPGVDRVPTRSGPHGGPLDVHDVARVADQLAGQRLSHDRRHELRRLELLDDDLRLRLRAAPGGVVALEGEEDDEADQDREARREHAEHAGGPVAVREVASGGCVAPDEQHHGDRRPGDDDHDDCRDEDGHGTMLAPRRPRNVDPSGLAVPQRCGPSARSPVPRSGSRTCTGVVL
jgi:hypothetical protein